MVCGENNLRALPRPQKWKLKTFSRTSSKVIFWSNCFCTHMGPKMCVPVACTWCVHAHSTYGLIQPYGVSTTCTHCHHTTLCFHQKDQSIESRAHDRCSRLMAIFKNSVLYRSDRVVRTQPETFFSCKILLVKIGISG